MNTFTSAIKSFIDDENGVTAIEYGLIAALIASALVLGLGVVTSSLDTAWVYIQDQINAATA